MTTNLVNPAVPLTTSAPPTQYDFSSTESIQSLLSARPQATFKFETLTNAITLGNVDVVTLMIIQNQRQNKDFTREQLATALIIALQKPKLVDPTDSTKTVPDIAMIKQLLAAGAGAGKVPVGTMGVCGNDLQAYILAHGLDVTAFPEIILWAINNSYLSPNEGIDLVVSLTQEARKSARDSNRAAQASGLAGSQASSRAGSRAGSSRDSSRATGSQRASTSRGRLSAGVPAAAVNPTVTYQPGAAGPGVPGPGVVGGQPQSYSDVYQMTNFEVIPARQ